MFSIMKKMDLDFKDRSIIYNFYKNQNVKITINKESTSAKKNVEVQDKCASLFIYCYIERNIKEVKDKFRRLRIRIKVGVISMIRDDIVLVTEMEHNLQDV